MKKRQAWVQRKTGKWVQEVQTSRSKKTEGVIKRQARGSKETSKMVEEGKQKEGSKDSRQRGVKDRQGEQKGLARGRKKTGKGVQKDRQWGAKTQARGAGNTG